MPRQCPSAPPRVTRCLVPLIFAPTTLLSRSRVLDFSAALTSFHYCDWSLVRRTMADIPMLRMAMTVRDQYDPGLELLDHRRLRVC